MKKSNLINETVMYSVSNGEVITHHLPWDKSSPLQAPHFDKYIERGFTFDRPDISVDKVDFSKVPEPSVKTLDIKRDIPKNYYYCSKCEKNHMQASNQGRKHLKHKEN